MVYHPFKVIFTFPLVVSRIYLIKFQLEHLVSLLLFSLNYIVNDQLFDKLVRKPYERQQYHPKFISNMKFAEIIIKHGLIDSSIMYSVVFDELLYSLCSTLGVCALCSQFGWLSPSLIQSFSDSSFFLNKLFPFLQSISVSYFHNYFINRAYQ